MKKIVSLVLVIIMVIGLSGCEGFVDEVGNVGTYDSEENFTVVIDGYYTQEEVDDLLQAFCEEFFDIEENCITAHKDVNAVFEEYDTELQLHAERLIELRQENDEIYDLIELLYDNYVEYDHENKLLLSRCQIVDGIKHCNILVDLNHDYVSVEQYQELLDRIKVLEGE